MSIQIWNITCKSSDEKEENCCSEKHFEEVQKMKLWQRLEFDAFIYSGDRSTDMGK